MRYSNPKYILDNIIVYFNQLWS